MPEGPEVRKYADALDTALTGRAIVSLEARTKDARKWLEENEQRIIGRGDSPSCDVFGNNLAGERLRTGYL